MYPGFIKYFSIFLFCIYILLKLLNRKLRLRTQHLFIFIFSCILSILSASGSSYYIPLIILWVFTTFYIRRPQITFIVTIISFAISFCAHCSVAFVSTMIIYILTPNKISYLTISLLTTIFHVALCISLLRIKRFKNGLPMSLPKSYTDTATLLCTFFVFLPILFPAKSLVFKQHFFAFLLISFTLAFLIFWWQAQITKSYRHRLLMRELESLRTSEAEKDVLIEKLYAENDRLARITHRDNSLITALKDATIKGLCTDFENLEDMIATREKLIANIEKLAEGRSSTSSAYNKRTPREFDTGLSLLDDLLHHMDKEALEQDIMFSVHFGTLLTDFVPENISESDLTHTVDDLLKNAFKSTRTCESRAVQLQFYKLGKHLVIEVADNGIPFEVRSLVNMGIEQLTTYEDGSGIGLMDIWSTKENYRATYHLDEYATSSPFSKKISLTFDKKNRYTIRTYRKDEILQMSRRADLQVYDDQE